mgnify:CR=1 FL=1
MSTSIINSTVLMDYGPLSGYHAKVLVQRYDNLTIADGNETARAPEVEAHPKCRVAPGLDKLDAQAWEWTNSVAVIATWGQSHGLHTHYIDDVKGNKASKNIARGAAL